MWYLWLIGVYYRRPFPVPLKSRELHEHAAIFCIAAENPRCSRLGGEEE